MKGTFIPDKDAVYLATITGPDLELLMSIVVNALGQSYQAEPGYSPDPQRLGEILSRVPDASVNDFIRIIRDFPDLFQKVRG